MKRLTILIASLLFVGCQQLEKLPGFGKDQPPQHNALPATYTVTGVTQSDFDLVPVRVLNSRITVRVNRANRPLQGWHDCDEFEVFFSTKGTGGGFVRFWYLNLEVGGISFPVAPTGTPYEITSTLITP